MLAETERPRDPGSVRRSTRNANGSSNTSSSRFADREKQRELIPRGDVDAADLTVLGRDPCEVADRTGPAQNFLDGVREQIDIGAQLFPLGAVLAERQQAAADRVAGGLVAGLDEQLAIGEQLLLGERRAVDRSAQQVADKIFPRLRAPLLDEPLEIAAELARARSSCGPATHRVGDTRDRPCR